MCVSDPPGSQEASGFCQQAEVQAIVPPGVTEPARVRALRRLVDAVRAAAQRAGRDRPVRDQREERLAARRHRQPLRAGPDSTLDAYISGLQAQLGKGTDYQGALAYAYSAHRLRHPAHVDQTNPELLPRTRYVVVFLTDGTPYPRCSANDNLTVYADPNNPDLTWADSSSAGEFCNLLDATTRVIAGRRSPASSRGTDRNQNYQLFSYVTS